MEIDESQLFLPEEDGGPRRRRRRLTRDARDARRLTRRIVWGVVALSGLVGLTAPGEPTGWWLSDALVLGGMCALFSLAGSRSRRSSWMWGAGVAAVSAPSLLLLLVGLVATGLSVAAYVLDRRKRIEGAAVGGLVSVVVVRLGDVGFFGASLLVGVLVVSPLLVSAYRTAPRKLRGRVHQAGLAALGFAAVAGVSFAVGAALARGPVAEGIEAAQSGLDAARSGDEEKAADRLHDAADAFEAANGRAAGWWARPALLVPGLGQQARAIESATREGASVARTAAEAAESVPVGEFGFEEGGIDIALVRTAQRPLAEADEAIVGALAELERVDTPWLLPPVSSRLDRLSGELRDAQPDAELAAHVARVAPGLLGGDGTRRYFVAFTTPSEARGLGGFMGNYVEITAVDGQLELVESGRTDDLQRAAPDGWELDTSPGGAEDPRLVEYVDRYGVFDPGPRFPMAITRSPDFPVVAEVFRQAYDATSGRDVDGVVVVDPYALAELMRFTGPIRVEGLDRALTPENAARFLLEDQYIEFGEREERADFLDDVARTTFEELTTGDIPDPREASEILSPLTRQGRLSVHAFDPDEQALFERVGADGRMPDVGPVDALSVTVQNQAHNKIDVYLHRSFEYRVTVDPDAGRVSGTLRIRLHNDVPRLDLPDALIGSNDQGLPPGTNEALIAVYTPLQVTGARLDGESIGLGPQREFGRWVYSAEIRIAAGDTADLVLDVTGVLPAFDEYVLGWAPQPLVNPDEVTVDVTVVDGWQARDSDVFEASADGRQATTALQPTTDAVWSLPLERQR